MSVISRVLFLLIFVNGVFMMVLLLKVRSILIKLGEKENYFMVSLISDLLLLKKISKAKKGEYKTLIIQAVFVYLSQVILVFLMILFM